MKKIIPAIAILIVSALMLASASFAWFTMNKTVTATGMNFSVSAPDNLQIGIDDPDNADSIKWGSSIDVKSTGTLSPSSSVDGISFCGFVSYANNTNVVNGVIETQTALDTLISDGYILPVGSAGTYTSNNTAYAAYKDFKFYIKTVNVINVGFKATITEPDNKNGIYKATRIALINSNKTTGLTSDNKYIVQSSVNPAAKIINSVYTESEGVTTGSYTLVSDAHLATEFGETSPSVFSVGVDYVTFYLRIWVEGNDPDCILENEVISPDLNVSIVFNVVE